VGETLVSQFGEIVRRESGAKYKRNGKLNFRFSVDVVTPIAAALKVVELLVWAAFELDCP
jgi:hypothetical protein